jgi:hypothetical protein
MSRFDPKPIEQWNGMRVLTVREPWASLIVTGYKNVENRSRYFGHRGPLLIHASGTLTLPYYRAACQWILANVPDFMRPEELPAFEKCKANCGKIIGGCKVYDCRRINESSWFDNSGFALELGEAWTAVEPVAFKGQLSLGTFRKAVAE